MASSQYAEPPQSSSIHHIRQAWFRLWTFLYGLFVKTGWSNVLYVDGTNGNDDTAKRGSITYSYATIQAALDDAQAGDVVWVSPGTYAEVLVWPDTDNVTLKGAGDAVTVTSGAAATLYISPTADVVAGVEVIGVDLVNSGVGLCVSIDGTACPGLGNNADVVFQDVGMTTGGGTAVNVNICGGMEFMKVNAGNEDVDFAQTGRVLINNMQCGTLRADNDPAGTEPTATYGAILATASIFGGVALSNLADFAGTDDVQIKGDFEAALVDTATAVGSVNFSGRILGNVLVTFDLGSGAATVAVFDYARITGSFTVGRVAGGAGTDLGTIRALHATFFSTGAGDITADSLAVLDIRGAQFAQAALAGTDTEGTGTAGVIDRTHWYQTDAAAGGPNNQTFDPDYPVGTTDYTVLVESDDLTNQPVAISNKQPDGFDCTDSAAAGNLRFHVIRPFD